MCLYDRNAFREEERNSASCPRKAYVESRSVSDWSDVSQRFSLALRKEADPIWTKILAHPFIAELATGTLPIDKFTFYVTQDYLFLLEFARCLALATAKSGDIESMRVFSSMLESSLTVEFQMLEALATSIGIPVNVLRKANPAPWCAAYAHHLVSIAYSGTVGEILAALLPCMWTYQEIGQAVARSKALRSHKVYSEWCDTYLAPQYADLVSHYRKLTDQYASGAGTRILERMRDNFLQSSRYEYMFWDMAYNMQVWPDSTPQHSTA